jgi:hypothetical protein
VSSLTGPSVSEVPRWNERIGPSLTPPRRCEAIAKPTVDASAGAAVHSAQSASWLRLEELDSLNSSNRRRAASLVTTTCRSGPGAHREGPLQRSAEGGLALCSIRQAIVTWTGAN